MTDDLSRRMESVQNVKLKGVFPFRLGATSYIIPDNILPNLLFLRDLVDDVELILFESHEFSNLPTPGAVEEMARIGRESNLTFTVHLPLDTRLGSGDETERRASVEKCRFIIDLMQSAGPFAWVLHLHGDKRGNPPSDNIPRWIKQNRRSLDELLTDGLDPRRVCVETLDYDFEFVAELVESFDLSVCLDIGHLLVRGSDVSAHLDRWMDRARVFHIHGVDSKGDDHRNLKHFPKGLLEGLATRLSQLPAGDERVMTMEIFDKDDFEQSIQAVAERLAFWRM